MVSGQFRGSDNQGNDCSVPNCTFTDSAGNQWRMHVVIKLHQVITTH